MDDLILSIARISDERSVKETNDTDFKTVYLI